MKNINRPLTKNMIAQLKLARTKELLGYTNLVVTSEDFKGTLKGLYQRGYINTRKIIIKGKEIEGIYITFEGVNFLSRYEVDVAQKKIAI